MFRCLDDYLALPYTIEVIPDNGAWFVRIKELPGCMTEVDTWEEILPAIEEAKHLWLELALERGRQISTRIPSQKASQSRRRGFQSE
jgi:predicted RNase H-like HicB family nuclease